MFLSSKSSSILFHRRAGQAERTHTTLSTGSVEIRKTKIPSYSGHLLNSNAMMRFIFIFYLDEKQQVGPPRNVTVTQTDEGDEFVVSWYPPEYGLEFLQVYVVS